MAKNEFTMESIKEGGITATAMTLIGIGTAMISKSESQDSMILGMGIVLLGIIMIGTGEYIKDN